MRGDDALATILLVSRIASDGTIPLNTGQFWRLVDQVGHPGDLLGRTESDLTGSGLAADMAARVVGLLGRATVMAFELERLDQSEDEASSPNRSPSSDQPRASSSLGQGLAKPRAAHRSRERDSANRDGDCQ